MAVGESNMKCVFCGVTYPLDNESDTVICVGFDTKEEPVFAHRSCDKLALRAEVVVEITIRPK